MPKATPKPDEYGRLRVRDEDTGHERSIHAAELSHGNYVVLDEAASSVGGDALPPKHAAPRVPVEPTASGQQADTKKENTNG